MLLLILEQRGFFFFELERIVASLDILVGLQKTYDRFLLQIRPLGLNGDFEIP